MIAAAALQDPQDYICDAVLGKHRMGNIIIRYKHRKQPRRENIKK